MCNGGIPNERLLRLLRHLTEAMTKENFDYACGEGGWYGRFDYDPDIEDLATIARIISGEKWAAWQTPPTGSFGVTDLPEPGGGVVPTIDYGNALTDGPAAATDGIDK